MQDEEQKSLKEQLEALRVEHRELDDAIERLHEGPYIDDLLLQRLKKRKLFLKDYISNIESRLIPDIDA